jgi:hypothetical protein
MRQFGQRAASVSTFTSESGENSMTPSVQVGTILIGEESPRMAEVLALESAPYFEQWSLVKALDGFALDDKIHATGWNFFFLAGEVKAMFFGAIGAKKVREALKRILQKVKQQNFNCLEVAGIVAKRFLGVPYATVSAHSRHIQQSCQLDDIERRRSDQREAHRT